MSDAQDFEPGQRRVRCSLLHKERDHRSEDGTKTDDDCIGDTESEAFHGNAEKNLCYSPAGPEQHGDGKLMSRKGSIGFKEPTDKRKGERPGDNDKGKNTEHQPDVLPLPRTHEFHGEHAAAGHKSGDHDQGNSQQQRMSHQ